MSHREHLPEMYSACKQKPLVYYSHQAVYPIQQQLKARTSLKVKNHIQKKKVLDLFVNIKYAFIFLPFQKCIICSNWICFLFNLWQKRKINKLNSTFELLGIFFLTFSLHEIPVNLHLSLKFLPSHISWFPAWWSKTQCEGDRLGGINVNI